jgi:hypothetical protein
VTSENLPPLPPDVVVAMRADAAQGAGAGEMNPPDLVRQRVLGRLRQSIAATTPGSGAGPGVESGPSSVPGAGAQSASPLARLAGGWMGKTVLLAALVGGGAALHAVWPSGSRPATVGGAAPAVSAPSAAAEIGAGAAAGTGKGAAETTAATGSEARPAEHAPATRTRLGASSRANRLAAERALLDRARRALMRGDGDAALDPLGRHATSFPRGQLVEEREGMRVKALVLAGRRSEARARANSFRRRFPHSLFLPVVEAALR